MNLKSGAAILLLVSVIPVWVAGEEAVRPLPVEVSPIKGDLHQLRCFDNVGVIAFTGEEGTLLVDTGYGASAEAVRDELSKLSELPIRLIVNTHADMDHVGGNAILSAGAIVIAHPAVRRSMRRFHALPPIETPGQPTVTIGTESTIHFNGEEVRLLPIPGGHSSGDVVVHFTEHKVACIGDMVLLGTFPAADPSRGGDAQQLVENLEHLRSLLPADTTLVAAHGGIFTMDELDAYIEMIKATTAAVADEIEADRSLTEILERNPLAPWAEWERPDAGLTFERWNREIYSSLTGNPVLSVCVPVTETLEAEGRDAAVARYRQLARDEPEMWQLDRWLLNALGYQLLARERFDDAIAIFTLNAEVYPDHFDPWDSLGEAYMRAGKDDAAIANYNHSLKLNPDNANAVRMLARIRGDAPAE